jgi:hypothetical protein
LTVRGIIWISWSGHTTPVQFDTNLEPTWTWEANGFKNERNLRVNSTVMTCDNTASRCDLAYATMYYRTDSSVPTIIANDLVSTILPAFSQVNGGPQLVPCGGPCTEDVTNSGMSVMCAARSTNATDAGERDFNGNHYWHPRSADIQALGLMY